MDTIKDNGKKARVLWVSDLVTLTGFGRVAHEVLNHISKDYEIVGVGVNYHGDPHGYNFPIFPAFTGAQNIRSPYGENRVCELIERQDFDLVFILNDAWVIDRYLKAIKEKVTKKPLPKIVVYFPVDAVDHDPAWYNNFDIVSQAAVYTHFGEWVVRNANPTLNLKIIPHGVNADTFHPTHNTRLEAKQQFFAPYLDKMGDLSNSFIVLNVNRNQPRKKLDITMLGFAKFAINKPKDVKLYMHCGIVDASINVDTLANRYGIGDRLIVSSTNPGVQTVPDSRLNQIYNACDVGINTSMGEGWGLPNVEHAITKAAQIVPNHSACRELFYDCGLLMDTYGDFMFDHSLTVGKLVHPDEVAKKLEFLYQNPAEKDRLALAAYTKLTDSKYSWQTIAKQWDDVFMGVLNDTGTISTNNEGTD